MEAHNGVKEILCAIVVIFVTAAAVLLLVVFVRGNGRNAAVDEATVTEEMNENASSGAAPEVSGENPVSADGDGYTEILALSDFADEKWSEGIVVYNGKKYRYKNGLQNYLFLGIDNDEKVAPAADGISGGQSDAMFLLITDRNAQEIKIIAINRNTIVPIDVYDEAGNYLVQMDLQICLQHGYGDGMKLSCTRSVDAVNRLFKGIPISGYIALNMGGLPAVNDAIGGVELTPIESVKRGDITIKKGESVVLNGEQAYAYLRTRDVDAFGSANDRLKRQEQYILAVIEKLLADPSKANRIYEDGADYIVASIDLPKLVKDSKDMIFTEDQLYAVPGETVFRDDFERYEVDEDGMIRLILNVFYEELP
ncbi:MAG: LCP family protein [Lachnospiraceae bacterium]|nr:LCP family protein [Lachnospiraceae bacterium]